MSLTSYRAAPSRDAFGLHRIYRFRPVALVGHCRPLLTFFCELRYIVIVLERIFYEILLGLAVTYSPTT